MINELRKARLKKGLTQEELAKRLSICQPTLSGIEAGKKAPSHALGIRIMEMFGPDIFLKKRKKKKRKG